MSLTSSTKMLLSKEVSDIWEYDYDELYHHGIKGMKWGVRRFQRKDGSLTPAGKRRRQENESSENDSAIKKTYDKVKDKTTDKVDYYSKGHRGRLEKRYMEDGMSAEEARAAADKRIKVEKVVAATAAVTVTACVAYYAKNKWVADHCDQILKAGTTFHNLDSAANQRPGEHLYVNYRQNDVNYFRGHFAVNKMRKTGSVFDHTLTATGDIKIPSLNTRKSVFKELYKNDPEFRAAFNRHSRSNIRGISYYNDMGVSRVYKRMWPKFGDKDTPYFNEAKRKYFEALKQKGYDAIVDEWDTNPRVFRSDAPLILLDTSSKSFGEMSIKELTKRDILLAQANSKNWTRKTELLNKVTASSLHANHFKESEKYLSRYATKSARNAKRIDRALDAIDKADPSSIVKNNSTLTIDNIINMRYGKTLANAGKYLEKHSNMSVDAAVTRAFFKDVAIDMGVGSAGLVGGYAALYKVSKDLGVERYIRDHPNTKMTTKEIERMLARGY